jgi:hypothetical protein
MYGQTAIAASLGARGQRQGQQRQRPPDDMAQQVEDASSELARKEMAAARWLLTDQDVKPALGTIGAFIWQTGGHGQDQPGRPVPPVRVRVEAGSTKRQNKEVNAKALEVAMQNVSQMLFSYAQATGDVQPINALMGDWANSLGLDGDKYLLKPPPPPAPPPGPAQGAPAQGAPNQVAA